MLLIFCLFTCSTSGKKVTKGLIFFITKMHSWKQIKRSHLNKVDGVYIIFIFILVRQFPHATLTQTEHHKQRRVVKTSTF